LEYYKGAPGDGKSCEIKKKLYKDPDTVTLTISVNEDFRIDKKFYCLTYAPHLEVFRWVQRDSYLPQGSQGLKEDKKKTKISSPRNRPEEMVEKACSQPQLMSSYSVSDVVVMYYLYQNSTLISMPFNGTFQ